jgi:hypothetical protein
VHADPLVLLHPFSPRPSTGTSEGVRKLTGGGQWRMNTRTGERAPALITA